MSAEIERFLADAKTSADLQAGIAQNRSSLDALVGFAASLGYAISRADADAYVAARKSELDDAQLDHVAGGGHKKKGQPATNLGIHDEYQHFVDMKNNAPPYEG